MGHEPGRLRLVVLQRGGFIHFYYPTIIRRARRERLPRSVDQLFVVLLEGRVLTLVED